VSPISTEGRSALFIISSVEVSNIGTFKAKAARRSVVTASSVSSKPPARATGWPSSARTVSEKRPGDAASGAAVTSIRRAR
jgi:hypothetical protein